MKRLFFAILLLLIFLVNSNVYSQYADSNTSNYSFYIAITGNYATLKTTESWKAYGTGGALGFNWSSSIDIEFYFDYLKHSNPYPSIADMSGWEIAMKSTHLGSKLSYTIAQVFCIKMGLGVMNLSTDINDAGPVSEKHFEFTGSGGLILPISGIDILIEGRYRKIFARNSVSLIGIVGGLILFF